PLGRLYRSRRSAKKFSKWGVDRSLARSEDPPVNRDRRPRGRLTRPALGRLHLVRPTSIGPPGHATILATAAPCGDLTSVVCSPLKRAELARARLSGEQTGSQSAGGATGARPWGVRGHHSAS